MGHKKLIRFAAIKTFPNVLENPENMKGEWGVFFKNQNTILLELACGKGEYSIGLGTMFPEKNMIGVDLKGNRIYVGAKNALQNNLGNIAFLRSQIERIHEYFNPEEVSEIWLTFPDPQLRVSHAKKRLTHPRFLRLYQQFLKPDGLIHLKTDSPVLYEFTKTVIKMYGLELIKDYNDVGRQASEKELLDIKTHYESLDIAKSGRIHYLQFKLPIQTLPIEIDEQLKQATIEQEIGREH